MTEMQMAVTVLCIITLCGCSFLLGMIAMMAKALEIMKEESE